MGLRVTFCCCVLITALRWLLPRVEMSAKYRLLMEISDRGEKLQLHIIALVECKAVFVGQLHCRVY